jgi:hypothetical protein
MRLIGVCIGAPGLAMLDSVYSMRENSVEKNGVIELQQHQRVIA